MMKNKLTSVLLILAIFFTSLGPLTGCASTTTISSDPAGAEVAVDGQPVGQTPVSFTEDSVWLWTKHQVTLKKKGYHTYNGQMSATVSVLHVILGIFCCLPLILVGEFKPTYHYVLSKKEASEMVQAWLAEPTIQFSE